MKSSVACLELKISIVVPAFNEEKRIQPFLVELINYCKTHLNDFEIIVVNDGSTDNTEGIVKCIIAMHNANFVKYIGYQTNSGKGTAIKIGICNAKGEKILFIDADGSIKPKEISRMLKYLDDYDLVIGDRKSKESRITRAQPIPRQIASLLFNAIVKLLFQIKVRDSLCGFKGFTSKVRDNIGVNLRAIRWVFDVELLYKAQKRRYKCFQMPIEWEHKDNSKVRLKEYLKIFYEIVQIKGQNLFLRS
ncbi:MAG: dolichyl-phosphate beta-glucosyltransferase [Candidatus Sigynarchaeota archaeon]